MVTVGDIEVEVAGSRMVRFAMDRVIKELQKAVGYFESKYGKANGIRICKDVILGKRILTDAEKAKAGQKFGNEAIQPLERLTMLNTAQKQYIFKRNKPASIGSLSYDII